MRKFKRMNNGLEIKLIRSRTEDCGAKLRKLHEPKGNSRQAM